MFEFDESIDQSAKIKVIGIGGGGGNAVNTMIDCQLNGIDFIRIVRAQRAYDSVRILMVTSEAQGQQVTQALKAGANEYLMKPFTKEALIEKLDLLGVEPACAKSAS